TYVKHQNDSRPKYARTGPRAKTWTSFSTTSTTTSALPSKTRQELSRQSGTAATDSQRTLQCECYSSPAPTRPIPTATSSCSTSQVSTATRKGKSICRTSSKISLEPTKSSTRRTASSSSTRTTRSATTSSTRTNKAATSTANPSSAGGQKSKNTSGS